MCGFCAAARLEKTCGKDTLGTLDGAVSATTDDQEPQATTIAGDTSTTATIAVGGTVQETLDFSGDTDWYRITLEEDQEIQIDLIGVDHAGGQPALSDPLVGIFNAGGAFLASNDDGPTGLDSRLIFTAPSAGTYYIEANSFGGSLVGDYELSVIDVSGAPVVQDTIPGDMSTSATISIGGSVQETLGATGDTDWFRIALEDGDTIQIDLNGADHAGSAEGELVDPFVRIYDSNGVMLQENDDITQGVQRDSRMVFTARETGDFYIEADSFENRFIGDYQLSVTQSQQLGELVTTLVTNSVMSTGRVAPGGEMEVRYYFAAQGEDFGQGVDADLNWTAYERQRMEAALVAFETVLNVTFTRVFNKNDADLKFVAGQNGGGSNEFSGSGSLGFAFFPGGGLISSTVVLNTDGFGWDRQASAGGSFDDGLEEGGFGFMTILHELGHAFGLDHTHEGTVIPGVSGNPQTDTGDFDLNQSVHSVMSYVEGWTEHPMGTIPNTSSGFTQSHAAGLMAIDIGALQSVYGANNNFASGSDTYDIADVTEVRSKYLSIWDTGGTDEITYSGARNAVIDLRPATLAVEQGGGGFFSYVDTLRGGFSIAQGVEIENATTGSGDDQVFGNDLANVITTNAGSDTIEAGGGDDVIFSGSEADTIEGGDGVDFVVAGAGDDSISGGEGADVLEGGTGSDVVDGGAGDDFLSAQSATSAVTIDLLDPSTNSTDFAGDTLISIEGILGASSVRNTLRGQNSDEVLIGGTLDDAITGRGGADVLLGQGGGDTIFGGGGSDVVIGGLGDDTLTGNGNADTFLFALNELAGEGDDLITDFSLTGGDLILFYGLLFPTELVSVGTAAGSTNALLSYGTDSSVELDGITAAEVNDPGNSVFVIG